MKLSVIIPAYNELKSIAQVLSLVARALPRIEKEIIVVDDRSRDGTREWLQRNLERQEKRYIAIAVQPNGDLVLTPATNKDNASFSIRVFYHDRNRGKGAALHTGLSAATGDVNVIQDADLEYDPTDWERMWPLIVDRGIADIVYGSRFYGQPHRSLYFHHYLANRLISLSFNMLYNQTLSDIEVCYKMFTRQVLHSLNLTSQDFGFEIEFSAQVARARRWRIYEVGIHYFGRTYDEGKKINWKDGVKALWYLVKYRL